MIKKISDFSSYNIASNVLTINHNYGSGLFSCCGIRLQEIINCYNMMGVIPIVDSSRQWYKHKEANEDLTPYFFKNNNMPIELNVRYVDISEATKSDPYWTRLSDYSYINFNLTSKFMDKYFVLSDEIMNIANMLVTKYAIDCTNTIAVCYRGNDMVKETGIPSYGVMLDKVASVRKEYPGHRLFIQSDELDFYSAAKAVNPDMISIDEIVKINRNSNISIADHLSSGRRSQAMLFMAIVYVISGCSHVIMNSSNVGMWICLYRNNAGNVYQYLDQPNCPLLDLKGFKR
jgi:hypothetical protein